VPLLFVEADCFVTVPLGAVSVKVTVAPEAGIPPLVATAVIDSVAGGVAVAFVTESATASDGGVITVTFAVPEELEDEVAAAKSTA
jgi:hypothetical protein